MSGPEDVDVHEFTRDWWERLPRHVRDADRQQAPAPFPLLRYLDGAGHQAGAVRDISRALWSGEHLNPDTAPDHMLAWVAYLLGFSPAQRHQSPSALRRRLQDHVAGEITEPGTRDHIVQVARGFLNPGARVQVLASAMFPWTLILGVSPEDVPGEDYELLVARMRSTGAVPAGHVLRVQEIRATWDQWEAAAGDTWEDKEANIVTWQDSDQAGVELQ